MKNKKVSSLKKVQACTLKTFNRMKRRIGFLIYQFVLPAIQVSYFEIFLYVIDEYLDALGVFILLGHWSRSQRIACGHSQC